jgi:transaldolase / glucose-6-phosphate isomerase
VITGAPSAIRAEIPDELRGPVAERAGEAARGQVSQRVWRHDPSLWGGPGIPEIENRLGWLNVSETMFEHAAELNGFAEEVRADGFTDAVLLGMGGSSLGPEVLRRSFGEAPDGLRLQVLDSTHPDEIKKVEESLDLERTMFIVSSKSGGTIETLSHYKYFKTLAQPGQFVVVTDPGSPLEKIAENDGLRRTFANPPDIGGRYSVLSYFGLVPAALSGVNVEELLHSAKDGELSCQDDSPESNLGLWLGAAIGELARRGRDKLTFFVSGPIESFGLWAEQLVAESTGKHGRGILPVAGEPLGEPGVYGPDRVFAYLRDADQPDEQLDAAVEQLAGAGHPTITLATGGPGDLGRIFFLSEFAVAVAGWALGINPFDQPDVQEAKDKSKEVLAGGSIPEIEVASDEALRALLADASPPHYVAVLGYLAYSEELDAAIAELRTTIRAATGAAVTFGYGPRFQHSTGQEHKGGAPNGRFLQLTDDPRADIEIPGESYSFGTLTAAEAAGDLQTLREHGLPAERVKLDGDPVEAVRALTKRIAGLLS